ncbi:MAG TPA: DNA-binding domain-containing protein [Polyangia bacterium]|nr:DNA-binding domain-containing protein [Polyangia bacterium]
MRLADTQRLFWSLLRGEPVDPTLVDRCFVGSAALPAADRIGIYANMYLWRQIDALREDFPKLARLLGDEVFFDCAAAYVHAHASEHPSLGKLGRHLAAFLRAQPPAERADLHDLAALEWARAEVFDAPAAPTLHAEALAQLSPAAFAAARLRMVPALTDLRLAHDVAALWRALEDEAPPPPVRARELAVAVWRQGFEVYHAALAPEEAEALRRARAGAPLHEICAPFAEHVEPAQAAFEALQSWCADGWVAELSCTS